MRNRDMRAPENENALGLTGRPRRTGSPSTTTHAADAAATLSHPTPTSLSVLQRHAGNAALTSALNTRQRQGQESAHASGTQSAVQRSPRSSRSRSPEPTTMRLSGKYVKQGNKKGRTTSTQDRVLYTSDLAPCVAVCGFNGSTAFMIHSDSTGTGGVGRTSLIDGIESLVHIGDGSGWTISLIGGSVRGCKAYLSQYLPGASLEDKGEADGAYITGAGVVARSKRRLARKYGVDQIIIED